MGAYQNFVQDFPRRCRDLLLTFHAEAAAIDREVTLTIAIASAGLVVPFERLKEHPIGDRERFEQFASNLDELLGERFDATSLSAGGPTAWRYGTTKSLHGEPDCWQGLNQAKPIGKKKAGAVLHINRNALAHGNIWTRGNPISELVFAKEFRDSESKLVTGYEYVRGSPQSFRSLLIAWFEILDRIGIDPKCPSQNFLNLLNRL